MTVSAQPTSFQYSGNGVTTVFAYNCQVLQPNDLYVYVNGLAVTTGITKTGIGQLTGGTVIFAAAPANGAQIIVEREVVLERTTDYQQNGDFLARVVNPDFNRIWMALQQLLTGVSRSIRFPKTDVNPATELPNAAARADKLLSFDSLGNPIVVAPSAQSATALSLSLAASTGGTLVSWIASGVGAVIRTLLARARDHVFVEDYGAVGDGVTDDKLAIQRAYTAGKVVHWGIGKIYGVSDTISITSDRRTVGNGATMKALNQTMTSFFTAGGAVVNNIDFDGLKFDGQGTFGGSGATAKFSNANVGIFLNNGGTNWRVHNCFFTGMDRSVTFFYGDRVSITDNHVLNNGLAGFTVTEISNFNISDNIINGVLGDDNFPGTTFGKFGDGVVVNGSVGGVVSGNQITRCVRIGIVLESTSAALNKNISITGNTISDLTNSRSTESNCGIWVEGLKSDGSITISGNTVRYTGSWTGTAAYGILCLNGGTVTGNKLYGTGLAAAVGYGVQAAIGNTEITGNHIYGFQAGVLISGPRVEDFTYLVHNNTIVSNAQYGLYIIGVASLFDIQGNIFRDNGFGLTLPGSAYGGVGIQAKSSGGFRPRLVINSNTFITSANEAATTGQLYGIILGDGTGGVPTVYSMKMNTFVMLGTYATPYPNGTVRPVCFGQDSGGGTVTILRDVIGDQYGNTCTKAPGQQLGVILSSGSGFQRYMGESTTIPSTAFPGIPSQIGDYYRNSAVTANGPQFWLCTTAGTPGTYLPVGSIGLVRAAAVSTTSGAALAALETNLNLLITNLKAANSLA